MKEFLLTNIDQNEYLNECDVCLAMCEYYLKQWTMSEVYQEAGITMTQGGAAANANQPAAEPAPQQQPAPTNGGGNAQQQPQADASQQNQNVNINVSGNIGQALLKLVEMLTKAIGQFVQNQASQVAQQQNEQMENEIEQLKEKASEQGTNVMDPATADQIVEELSQPDEEDKQGLTEKEKKLTKCVLVGNFQDCMILSPQSIEVLTKTNETLKSLMDIIKARTQSPEQLADTISKQLQVTINDQMLAPLAGGVRQDNMSSTQSTQMQMNWKQFRANEKNAFAQINQASKQLNVIDQQFRTGGLGGFLKWATSKDIRAQSVSKEAMTKLQSALGLVRKSLGFLMQDIQSVRKVNRKVIRKMRTICVGGNNSVANFGNRKSTQKAGVTGQWIGKQDKGKFQNFQGNAMNNGFNAQTG